MRYRVRTKWEATTLPGLPGECLIPTCAIDGVTGNYHGDAVNGQEFEAVIECSPETVPAVEATGTVILETMTE